MKKSEKIVLAILIIVLIAAFFMLASEANNQYAIWQQKRHQVKQPEKIESWMSFSQISKIIQIPPEVLFEKLNISQGLNPHLSLDLYCKQHNQNCSLIMEKLNKPPKE
ncbi:MAG: hypothetical protein NT076_04330 [Candidatus Pacearchaeota archaeon]|nr:hypothetical protein [Candidatus Pacearchaeota archaeon]